MWCKTIREFGTGTKVTSCFQECVHERRNIRCKGVSAEIVIDVEIEPIGEKRRKVGAGRGMNAVFKFVWVRVVFEGADNSMFIVDTCFQNTYRRHRYLEHLPKEVCNLSHDRASLLECHGRIYVV